MNIKLTLHLASSLILLGCQDTEQIDNPNNKENVFNDKNPSQKQEKKTKVLISKEITNNFPAPKIGHMPTPYLYPNGESEDDLFFRDTFFKILENEELLRNMLENYNTFTIKTNLNRLSHPAYIHLFSDDLSRLFNFRRIIINEIESLKNKINNYNRKINLYFPKTSHYHKMSGYYSFDNTHLNYNREEFSIEDVDNFSYSYHKKLITKNILKSENPKLKLHKPEVGNRRGTVFVTAGKPNIIRGTFGEDLGAYALGAAVGMTIEYAITGKIYYYKNAI